MENLKNYWVKYFYSYWYYMKIKAFLSQFLIILCQHYCIICFENLKIYYFYTHKVIILEYWKQHVENVFSRFCIWSSYKNMQYPPFEISLFKSFPHKIYSIVINFALIVESPCQLLRPFPSPSTQTFLNMRLFVGILTVFLDVVKRRSLLTSVRH